METFSTYFYFRNLYSFLSDFDKYGSFINEKWQTKTMKKASFFNFDWAELDSNQRSETQRIYNPLPLTTRAPTHSVEIRISYLHSKNNIRIIFDNFV